MRIRKHKNLNDSKIWLAFSLVTCLGLVGRLSAYAEEPERGRLADGRAYRVDQHGTQLVDYIAELEVQVDSLNRRVYGLESEVTEKQSLIERLQAASAHSPQPGLVEKDLVPARQPKKATEPQIEAINSNDKLGSINLDCTAEVEEMRLRAENREDALRAERERRIKTTENLRALIVDLKAKINNKDTEIDLLQSKLNRAAITAKSVSKVSTQRALEPKGPQLSTVSVKQSSEQHQKPNLKTAPKPISPLPAAEPALDSRARLRSPKPHAPTAPSISEAKLRAINTVRSTVKSEYNLLRGKIAARDKLFREYNNRSKSVGITPSRLVSGRSLNPAQIKTRIDAAQNISSLAELKRDINQIRRKVEEDIALAQRMRRMG